MLNKATFWFQETGRLSGPYKVNNACDLATL